MSKEQQNNNNLLMGVIILLLIVIAVGAFFYGKGLGTNNTVVVPSTDNNQNGTTANTGSPVEITVITDERCGERCNTTQLLSQLKKVPSLVTTNIKELDYASEEAKVLLEKTGIKVLPAAIFTNNFVSELGQFLVKTTDGQYSLELGSTYDPSVTRSDKGFTVLDKETLAEIKKGSYIKGNKEAPVTWIEYSDLECPFCAKLHNAGTPKELEEKYGDKLNQVFQSFPLDFHKNAMPGAEAIECLGKEKGSDAYYALIEKSFKDEKSDLDFLIEEAVKLGGNKESLEKCVENKTFSAKINKQQQTGTTKFGVTGTPGNVLINNATGEYEVISGAYPTASFVEIIDRLLK